jgi:hypothetical protein
MKTGRSVDYWKTSEHRAVFNSLLKDSLPRIERIEFNVTTNRQSGVPSNA